MKKWATALACLAVVAFVSPPALAEVSLESSAAVTGGRIPAAVPPAEPGASGAIIRDESCFETQLWDGGGSMPVARAQRVDLPFAMQADGKYWYDIWISPQGALSHDDGGLYWPGMDLVDADLIRSSEVYMPFFGGYSLWDGNTYEFPDYDPSSTYYGFTYFGGRQALCVTWLNITPQELRGEPDWVEVDPITHEGYWATSTFVNDPTRPNSYQALIVDRSDTGPGNFDLVFNYDSITWQNDAGHLDFDDNVVYDYAEAGYSLGIPGVDSEFEWLGMVDGRLDDEGVPIVDPEDQLPHPVDQWWPQHDAFGGRDTFLDSSPTGLAVTSTDSSQVGRHVFGIRRPPMLLWGGDWTHDAPQYVALGDSYQSGEGTERAGEFLAGTDTYEDYFNADGYLAERPSNQCHRSDKAYPMLLNSWIPSDAGVTLDFWACSGALISQMGLSGIKHDSPPWNDPGKPSAYARPGDDESMSSLDRLGDETWLVTIGIGGNDVGFGPVLASCVTSWVSCYSESKLEDLEATISGKRASLKALYQQIRTEAQNAAVFVLGYPKFFASDEEVDACWDDYEDTTHRGRDVPVTLFADDYETVVAYRKCRYLEDPVSGINRFEQRYINAGVAKLNDEIRAATHGQAFYVDIEDVGAGRGIGSSDDSSQWFMNGLLGPTSRTPANIQSFHPNALGHRLIATEFVRQLVEPRYGQTPVINPGEIKQYIYSVAGGLGSKLHVSGFWPGSDVVLTLVSPSGVEYTRASSPPGSTRVTDSLLEYIEISDPEPGDWTIRAYGADIAPGGESFLLDLSFEPPANALPIGEIQMERRAATVTFSAPGSVDPDGTIVEYWWDLGDGTLVTGTEVTHTYSGPGTYRIGLILTDDRGGEGFVFADNPVVVAEPGTAGTRPLSAAGAPEPSPSASVGPQPSPSPDVDETPGVGPSPAPSPSPSLAAEGPSAPGSGAWVWWIGLVLLVAAAVGGLWHLVRRS